MTSKQPPFQVRDDARGWVETPVKTVGRLRKHDPAASLEWNRRTLRLSPLYGRWCRRGVFCFRTWEEAETWTKNAQKQVLNRRP